MHILREERHAEHLDVVHIRSAVRSVQVQSVVEGHMQVGVVDVRVHVDVLVAVEVDVHAVASVERDVVHAVG